MLRTYFLKSLLCVLSLVIISSCSSSKTVSNTEKVNEKESNKQVLSKTTKKNKKNKLNEENKIYNNTVIVQQVGPDCGNSYLLSLNEENKTLLRKTVYELNLPESLKAKGLKVSIKWRKAKASEMMKCTTEGPGYDQIYIIEAEKVQRSNNVKLK